MADLAMVERLDAFAPLRNKLRIMAAAVDEFAGIPIPIEGEQLVVEKGYPFAALFNREEKPEPGDDTKIRNTWYSLQKRSDVVIFESGGKIEWGLMPAFHHIAHDLRTLGCSDVWGIEQESNAVRLLGTLLKHRAFKQYMLTGMFLETSKRSGVTYVFRRLKPTVAVKAGPDGNMRILCCLCAHPVAHYAGSWAGAMTPTDDVVAHLMMMRGDEPMYWKRSTQHPSWRPEAGL